MHQLAKRIAGHNNISNTLACMSNMQLIKTLATGKPMHSGIGGTSMQIEIDNIPVFVKKVPLTDLELQPENYMSTANIFNLPMCYQYGIGSTGFSAWRELASHIMTTNWALTGKCANFPIMHHWRILKECENKTISQKEQAALKQDSSYWENSKEIHTRLKAGILATHHIYLFMELMTDHLYQWLNKKLTCNEKEAVKALTLVESQMQKTQAFMQSQNFLHMDAHFENILTDGKQLYYSDFGLALSHKFNLSTIEMKFMQDHVNYDFTSGSINLLHCIITSFFGKKATFADYHAHKLKSLPATIDGIIQKHLPISLIMEKFYPDIQKDKSTTYPQQQLEKLLQKLQQPSL